METGIWLVMPECKGDHGTAIGLKSNSVQTHVFYTTMMKLLAATEPKAGDAPVV